MAADKGRLYQACLIIVNNSSISGNKRNSGSSYRLRLLLSFPEHFSTLFAIYNQRSEGLDIYFMVEIPIRRVPGKEGRHNRVRVSAGNSGVSNDIQFPAPARQQQAQTRRMGPGHAQQAVSAV